MTETPQRADEPGTSPVDTLPPPEPSRPEPRPAHPPRLYQAAAWVAVVAGVVFIVGAVFFTGFFLGRHGGGFGQAGHHRLDQSEFHRPPPRMMPLNPGPMGPGEWPEPGRGMGPGGPGAPTNPGTPPSPATPPARP
ncbi:MAG: hypothetical protein KDB72_07450 [Mycobacterium sp.]|nr:hypothetical protein [Mycobacterium sp.]